MEGRTHVGGRPYESESWVGLGLCCLMTLGLSKDI